MSEDYRESKLVLVEWKDAWSIDGWKTVKAILAQADDGEICKTVGYLLHEDDKRVVLAQSIGMDFVDASEVGNVWVIPRGMVASVTELRPFTATYASGPESL